MTIKENFERQYCKGFQPKIEKGKLHWLSFNNVGLQGFEP